VSDPAPALLAATGITRRYDRPIGSVVALEAMDLTLVGGEVVALVGRSGSGKTTLLNVLCGWEQPDAGRLLWRGRPDVRLDTLGWSDISIVPQASGLLEDLTVDENVMLSQRFEGTGDGSDHIGGLAVDQLFEDLGLTHLRGYLPGAISLGEQQRVAVARAVLLCPALVLADEPTAHQDAGFAGAVLDTFAAVAARGSCCVIATHSSEVMARADRVVTLRPKAP
jgi:ABC-type lipoprotein export system ATPase subunit